VVGKLGESGAGPVEFAEVVDFVVEAVEVGAGVADSHRRRADWDIYKCLDNMHNIQQTRVVGSSHIVIAWRGTVDCEYDIVGSAGAGHGGSAGFDGED
ncbi:hypothetical protein JL09_g6741, partial [Pichia kudriavzevii]